MYNNFTLQQGAEIESRDHKGWTALFHATYAGHQNMVKFLLEQGADMNSVYDYIYMYMYSKTLL